MPLIEGIGDEVFNVLLIVLVVTLGVLGWWSTNIPAPRFRTTVLILERGHHDTTENTTNVVTPSPPQDTGQPDTTIITDAGPETVELPNAPTSAAKSQTSTEQQPSGQADPGSSSSHSSDGNLSASGPASSNTVEQAGTAENTPPKETPAENHPAEDTSSTSQVSTEISASPNELRRRRLQFFGDRQEPENVTEIDTVQVQSSCHFTESQDHVQASTSSSIIPETQDSPDSKDSETVTFPSDPCLACDDIRIKLKFLNDNQKLVQGKLQEPLGDFKRRNFAVEIASSKVIRLIFNGQVLQSDDRTLQNYGLFDNCVVHCLVHNQRTSSPNVDNASNSNTGEDLHFGGGDAGEAREWDLSNVMYVSMFVILSAIWYLRINFSQLFSATSTVALFGLSGIFVIFLVGMYIPDQEVLRA